MRAPISIVNNETGELVIFKSVEAAEGIEAIDIELFGPAYDAEGRLLNLVITEQPVTTKILFGLLEGTTIGRWALQPAEAEPTHMGELRERLIVQLGHFGEADNWLRSASLDELLTRGVEKYRT